MKLKSIVIPVCLFAFLIGGLSLLLFIVASTARGRLVGGGVFLIVVGVFATFIFWLRGFRRRFLFCSVVSAAIGLALFITACVLTPTGYANPDSNFTQGYFGQDDLKGFRRFAFSNIVPERDQFAMGMVLFSTLDPAMLDGRGRELRGAMDRVYDEIEASSFDALGSSMQHAYAEILPGGLESGHYYLYRPHDTLAPEDNKKRPILIFLHGSLGNFKAYMHLLLPFAEEHQIAIIAPTFGLGNWNRPGGTDIIEQTRQWCVEQGFDSDQIYLGCISNGGRGLARAASQTPKAYKGLISISGYLEKDIIDDPVFLQSWQAKPFLILQGGDDRRVEEHKIRRGVEIMQMAGVDVDYRVNDSADHFMMMKQQDWTLKAMDEWYEVNCR